MARAVGSRVGKSPAELPRAKRTRNSSRIRNRRVFLNIPFDDTEGYEGCFLAYIAALAGIGLDPHCVLEVPSGGRDRLSRIFQLMRRCRYSIHDLSRVQLRAGNVVVTL